MNEKSNIFYDYMNEGTLKMANFNFIITLPSIFYKIYSHTKK